MQMYMIMHLHSTFIQNNEIHGHTFQILILSLKLVKCVSLSSYNVCISLTNRKETANIFIVDLNFNWAWQKYLQTKLSTVMIIIIHFLLHIDKVKRDKIKRNNTWSASRRWIIFCLNVVRLFISVQVHLHGNDCTNE